MNSNRARRRSVKGSRVFGGIFDTEGLEDKIARMSREMENPAFWNDPNQARKVSQEKAHMEKELRKWREIEQEYLDLSILIDLLESEDDPTLHREIGEQEGALSQKLAQLEIETLFSDPMDLHNAIVAIHPGAGGTESQDWAQMLFRMLHRWAERRGYQVEILDHQPGEEAGIKDVAFSVSGEYAFGYLKAEAGVHRLVRISPFDANKRRHTSFASVFVYPEIEEDTEVDIQEDDLRIDTYRASGAGGQHVNKTSSAVRITHLPSGIVVQCQNERSQHKNKSSAMKILRAKLYELKKAEQDRKMEEMAPEKKEIGWGSQIRSYVLQPYQMAKDHRTQMEKGNVNAVLDGEIDEFIEAYLRLKTRKTVSQQKP
jgi:peptide chain release factor 2